MSNLPPGVSLHMIPGNRPEDLAEEAFWEELEKRLAVEKVELPEDAFADARSPLVRAVEIAYLMGQAAGWNDATTAADLAAAYEAEQALADQLKKEGR